MMKSYWHLAVLITATVLLMTTSIAVADELVPKLQQTASNRIDLEPRVKLLYFYSLDCEYCMRMTETIERLKARYQLTSYEMTQAPGLVEKYEINIFPSIVVLGAKGENLETLRGMIPEDTIMERIKTLDQEYRSGMFTMMDRFIDFTEIPTFMQGKIYAFKLMIKGEKIDVIDAFIMEGYCPDRRVQRASSHRLIILDEKEREIWSFGFQVKRYISSTFVQDDVFKGGSREITEYQAVQHIPFFKNARSYKIIDRKGDTVVTGTLPDKIKRREQGIHDYTVLQKYRDTEDAIDVVFLGDDYSASELDYYRQDVEDHYQYLKVRHPFVDFRGVFNYYRVDNLMDLGCKVHETGGTNWISCNSAKVYEAASVLPYDEIIVIINSDLWAGTAYVTIGGGGADSYAMSTRGDPVVTVHEFGHSFGGLMDEYDGGIENGPAWGPNCDNMGCVKWEDVPGTGCYQICYYRNLFRPTANSCVMQARSQDPKYDYCPVCLRAISKVIMRYKVVRPDPPINLMVTPIYSQSLFDARKYNKLTWSPADPELIEGYNVYRLESETSSFTRLNSKLINENMYIDPDLPVNQIFWYAATSVSNWGVESNYSKKVSDQGGDEGQKSGDVNEDGVFGDDDFKLICENFGADVRQQSNKWLAAADVNCNGIIDGADISILAQRLHGKGAK